MASSRGFGSVAHDSLALFRLAFASAPRRLSLNLAMCIHSPVHSSIGTPSGCLRDALGLLARQRFQGLFHSPHRGAFHRSLAVLFRYRSLQVLSLGGWSPLLPTAFHGRRRTYDPISPGHHACAYGPLTLSGDAFQSSSTRHMLPAASLWASPVGRSTPTPRRPQPTCTVQV